MDHYKILNTLQGADSNCDSNGIKFIILVSSNVDIIDQHCDTKWRFSHGNGILRRKISVVSTVLTRLFSKIVFHYQ